MKLENFKEVEDLYNQRSETLHRLAVVKATGHELTRHFNVHIHGTAQPAAISEIAARPLVGHYSEELARIDNQLIRLGVQLDPPTTDPLASIRPESIVAQNERQAGEELKTALTTIIRAAVNLGGIGHSFRLSDVMSMQDDGAQIPMGTWQIEAKRIS